MTNYEITYDVAIPELKVWSNNHESLFSVALKTFIPTAHYNYAIKCKNRRNANYGVTVTKKTAKKIGCRVNVTQRADMLYVSRG